jgi:hypothetical protein
MEYNAVQSVESEPTFRNNTVPIFSTNKSIKNKSSSSKQSVFFDPQGDRTSEARVHFQRI